MSSEALFTTGDVRLTSLMERYQGGDDGAFDELYSRLAPEISRYLGVLCRESATRDDLVQESFLQIHRVRHTYRAPRPVRPWAFGIARHVWQMHLRSRKRRERHELRFPASGSHQSLDLPRLVHRDAILKALPELPYEQREAVVLHHAFGFSFSEIGSLLGVRAGTAKLRAYRGLLKLRELLREERNHDRRP